MGSGLNYASAEIDASGEVTFVYSGKQTEDTKCFFGTLANESAIKMSPFGRLEDFITTGDSLAYEDVMTEARSWLQHKYRDLIINAHIQQDADIQFGRDYNFGDIVAFRYLGETYNIHLDEFKIIVDGKGKEDVSVISTNLERELLISVPEYQAHDPIIKNERLEDEDNLGVQLFYRHHSVGQSFVLDDARATLDIDYVDVMMRRLGIPQKNVSMTLYSGDLTQPITPLTAPVVVSYSFIPAGLYSWIRFALSEPLTISNGVVYWIVLSCGIPKSEYANYYRVGADSNQRYTPGSLRVSTNGTDCSVNVPQPPEGDGEEPEEHSGRYDMIFAIGGH